ncbi:nitroreductase family protein [Campylobacter upsaliensis]
MNFKEMLEKRHACKLFDGRKIPEEDLKFILESGVLAPSSHGFEPWKFFVLNDRQEELSTLMIALGYSDDEEIPAKSRFEFDEVVRFLD